MTTQSSLIILDIDNTLVPYQPTKMLYFSLFLKKRNLKYIFIAQTMIFFLRYFWMISPIVNFQRKWIMTLFSRIDTREIEEASEKIACKVVTDYKESLGKFVEELRSQNDKVFLLSHCPNVIAEKLNKKLNFDGAFSIPVKDYFAKNNKNNNKILNKASVIAKLRVEFPDASITYMADDLIDFNCLKIADKGILVNASPFTKKICKVFLSRALIWN